MTGSADLPGPTDTAGPVAVPVRGPLEEARFVERPNRFLVRARLGDGRVVGAHLPDPGRLRELLVPGRPIWLRREDAVRLQNLPASPPPASASGGGSVSRRPRPRKRKTGWTAVLVPTPDGRGLVSVDTTLPNRLVGEALRRGRLPELGRWELERAEARIGASRIDFLLRDRDGRRLALEVKSVTLVEGGVGLFPDAVTARGARHVRELAALAREEGWEAAILFVVQRPDARRVVAARAIDPVFADALAGAREAGVRVLGRRCHVHLDRVALGAPVPAG